MDENLRLAATDAIEQYRAIIVIRRAAIECLRDLGRAHDLALPGRLLGFLDGQYDRQAEAGHLAADAEIEAQQVLVDSLSRVVRSEETAAWAAVAAAVRSEVPDAP